MKQTSAQPQTTNSRKASSVYRYAVASVLLFASVCAQAGATECSSKAQASEKCPQSAIRTPAVTSVSPRATTTPANPTGTAGKHGIIFVGGRVGPQSDTRTINSQPVPPGHSPDTQSINSQPVPPGRAAHKHPLPGDPVERTRHSKAKQQTQVRS